MSAKKKSTVQKTVAKKAAKPSVKTKVLSKKVFDKNVWLLSGVVVGLLVCLGFIFVKPLIAP